MPRSRKKKRQNIVTVKEKLPVHEDHTYCMKPLDSHVDIDTPTDPTDADEFIELFENRSDVDNIHLDCLEEECIASDSFEELKSEVKDKLQSPYSFDFSEDTIKIFQLYPSDKHLLVKLNITINRDFKAKITVHKIELEPNHDIWLGLPLRYDNFIAIKKLLDKLNSLAVCVGNYEEDFLSMVPPGSIVERHDDSSNCRGFRETDFGAVSGDITYSSTIRNFACKLLVNGKRCSACSHLRRILNSRRYRQDQKEKKTENSIPDYLSPRFKHCNMSKRELIGKIDQQKEKITSLQAEINRKQRQFQKEVANKGVSLDACQSIELRDTMAACTEEMEKAFPDANSYQRLFWAEQFKSINVKSSKGMRWHPMVIRWCLYLRHKSNAAYEALRDSGFITLPSSRTLFDYSHYTRSGNGYQTDVLDMLKEEAVKLGLHNKEEPYKKYVGVLFDEIQIKSDLVYDKYSGELVGYCDLDKVGNQLMEFEKYTRSSDPQTDVAKYMLVVMVRGAASSLKFPLASFPTMSITADFLYPIIWKGIRLLETYVDLRVLFLTCDGASANRKFFGLHGDVNDFIYYTENPYALGNKLYFISDVPHLIKTTRNCFCNSYAHKKTRKMWKDGKDISWLHLLRLFEEHCELNLYTPCPKLTRQHIDITPFGCMKVNYAAQVLSSSVANALEVLYDDNVSETVNFIRNMNKFFDCLNVRSLFEGRNKRNPDLNPYTAIDDERLRWLKEDFLNYFSNWETSITNRVGNFAKKDRNGMILSHQTLLGLKISVNSIVECVKTLLNIGAKFVFTHSFNQDPLEQQFGQYRHRAGDNCNPTVYDVRHMMTQMRPVGAQALAPRNGNIRRENRENYIVDNSKLKKRRI